MEANKPFFVLILPNWWPGLNLPEGRHHGSAVQESLDHKVEGALEIMINCTNTVPTMLHHCNVCFLPLFGRFHCVIGFHANLVEAEKILGEAMTQPPSLAWEAESTLALFLALTW